MDGNEMNDLSWLLYLAGIAKNIQDGLGFFGFLFFILFLIFTVVSIISAIQIGDNQFDMSDPNEVKVINWLKRTRIFAALTMLLFMTTCLSAGAIPDKQTIYAIAASEMGEEVIKTPQAQKAFKAIDIWMDKQIVAAKQPVTVEQPE